MVPRGRVGRLPHLPHGVVSDPAWTFQKVRPVTGMVGVEVAIFVTVLVFDAVQASFSELS